MNSGMDGLTILVALLIIMAFAAVISLLNALVVHPWLWLFVIGAVVIFIMAKRAERRERGGR
jgi:Flp pilus assembly protein TadB